MPHYRRPHLSLFRSLYCNQVNPVEGGTVFFVIFVDAESVDASTATTNGASPHTSQKEMKIYIRAIVTSHIYL